MKIEIQVDIDGMNIDAYEFESDGDIFSLGRATLNSIDDVIVAAINRTAEENNDHD